MYEMIALFAVWVLVRGLEWKGMSYTVGSEEANSA